MKFFVIMSAFLCTQSYVKVYSPLLSNLDDVNAKSKQTFRFSLRIKENFCSHNSHELDSSHNSHGIDS